MRWNASGKELTWLLTYFPKLSELRLHECENVTELAVNVKGQRATETPGPSSSANINKVEQQQGERAEDDVIVASEEAERSLLLLPPQLQELFIHGCPELSLLRSNPHDDSNEDGYLQVLTSLRWFEISGCSKFFSSYLSSSFSYFRPFPNSLEYLSIQGVVGSEIPVPLSYFTSLTNLSIFVCGDLRGKELFSLLAQGHLTKLFVKGTHNFFVDSEPSQVHEQEIPLYSSKLQELEIEDVAGFTTASIRHGLLFSLLTKLEISASIRQVERFTEEQEALLFVNSLEDVTFSFCHNLQSLPERLYRLPNLKRLYIDWCIAIQMLPKDGLPSSLEELIINICPEIRSLPKDCLPDSLQKLVIINCPAIQSLPEVDDLPSSLREIDVRNCGSEKPRRQCCKLINIIPIVRA